MSYMKSRLARVFLGLWLLGLAPAYGQEKTPPEKPWTGKLANGRVITRDELSQILKDQYLWRESHDKEMWAALSKADLSGADLSGAMLSYANLFMTKLIGAQLIRTKLSGAMLSDANLSDANLSDANLYGAD